MGAEFEGGEQVTDDAVQIPDRLPTDLRALCDERLAGLATNGDPDALGELYRRYAPAVRGVCAGRGPTGEAEDLVSETFLALAHNGGPLAQPEKVRHWLVRTACNLAATASRAHRNSRTDTVPADVATSFLDGDATTDPSIDRLPDRLLVEELLADLPDVDAQLLRSYYLDDEPLDAIAGRFASTYDSIKVRMHTARRKLRDHVDPRGLHGLLPAPLVRFLDGFRPAAPLDPGVAAALVPVIAGLGLTALALLGPTADGTSPPSRSTQTSVMASSTSDAPVTRSAEVPPQPHLDHRATTTPASGDDTQLGGNTSRPTDLTDPALLPTDPIDAPGGRTVSTQPDTPPDYEIGVDSGARADDVAVGLAVSIHDEPTLEPAAESSCPVARSTPYMYCHVGDD